jgi:hypothetical protein
VPHHRGGPANEERNRHDRPFRKFLANAQSRKMRCQSPLRAGLVSASHLRRRVFSFLRAADRRAGTGGMTAGRRDSSARQMRSQSRHR